MRQRRRNVESARARDLIGLVLLGGAALYVLGTQRASLWFLVASGVAIVAQLVGFFFRAAARARAEQSPSVEVDEDSEDEELGSCPTCGHGKLIELDAAKLLGGLAALTAVSASVCPDCGTLTGAVERPENIPIGDEHGTTLRQSLSGEGQEVLQEPEEHDG